MSETITSEALHRLVAQWLQEGRAVIGPVNLTPKVCRYKPLSNPDELVLDGFIRPRNSIKEFFFPQHEELFRYRFSDHGVVLEEASTEIPPFILLAVRPCDAAALPMLDNVFGKEDADRTYVARRAAGTVVTMACDEHDRDCFCTVVHLGPESEAGSDAMLVTREDGAFEVRTFSEKGSALFAGQTESREACPLKIADKILEGYTIEQIREFLLENFEHPVWETVSAPCLGCGACAFTCPTCHCFDIVDEGNAAGGARVRNWDSCQFCMFTKHASGHNPRPAPASRQRQRLQHKFRMFPEKFGTSLCTGCGNCTHNCPIGLGVLTALREISHATINQPPEAKT